MKMLTLSILVSLISMFLTTPSLAEVDNLGKVMAQVNQQPPPPQILPDKKSDVKKKKKPVTATVKPMPSPKGK